MKNSQVFGLRTLGCFHVFFKKYLQQGLKKAEKTSVTGKTSIFEICP